ncbi:Cation/H(+) antiporter [Thalictrum thalictroides]|uniref:Cation/H(+) antiporter n=1 Tax=Thalictrum thalictroides TaxID=46969 RepID=A0A7J6WD87_THATH|nr:Cation/H(+) antiporter [Thalictrum thalictroides]
MSSKSQTQILRNISYICQYPDETASINSRGAFLGDNPLRYSVPLLMLQLSIISLLSYATNYCLRPLGQTSVVTQILAGIILGPSLIGHNETFTNNIFPRSSHSTLETIASFGVMFFLFQTGVKTDTGLIKQNGHKSIVIGSLVFFFPLVIAVSLALVLRYLVEMDKSLAGALPMIAGSMSLSGFPVISSNLTELKIINTELGRLAISSSMITDLLGISWTAVSLALQQSHTDPLDALLGIASTIGMLAFIVWVIRPMTMSIVKHTPLGEPVRETHISFLFVAILVVGFISESIGQHFVLGPLVLGLALPDGPPLGAELVEKLDSLVSYVLFPTYLAVSGLKTNVFTIELRSIWIVATIVIFAFLVKVAAAMLPCLYCNMPWQEAFVLGLTLNTKGIFELLLYNVWKDSNVNTSSSTNIYFIDRFIRSVTHTHTRTLAIRKETSTFCCLSIQILKEQEFALTVFAVVMLTAFISPLMRILYYPSKRFVSSKKNNIQHAKHDAELGILVCVHKQEHVHSLINILEISHPTTETPIAVVLLQLVELLGRAAPVLVAHHPDHNYMCGNTRTRNIVNAFKQYEMQNQGLTCVQAFTGIAHFATMDDDICHLAIDKRVNFVITPFHKELAINGKMSSENRSMRKMNCNILEKAPCSVGIFIDRKVLHGSVSVLKSQTLYLVAVLYMGGNDDGETLAYGARMAEHPQVNLTVIRFLQFGCDSARERKLDNDVNS